MILIHTDICKTLLYRYTVSHSLERTRYDKKDIESSKTSCELIEILHQQSTAVLYTAGLLEL